MQTEKPQLAMKRELTDLPGMNLPEGYSLREFGYPDEKEWENIINTSFQLENADFDKMMRSDKEFKPERILFICFGDKPVATASAWYSPGWGEKSGYVHMVGALPSHSGKGLGYAVTLAALNKMVEEEREYAVLTTDDFRIPAIKTYLRLGFAPLIYHESHRQRWKEVLEQIGKPGLYERFAEILQGPLYIVKQA